MTPVFERVTEIYSGYYTDRAILKLGKEKMMESHLGILTSLERAEAGIIYEACMTYLRAKILQE
ncbi:hypothetical protein LCGC14_1237440 [marine sediment metagenome]|uniref:Uncharacterized protein n=1 Tax=marine sediment metagenome TaxID=412755 RepID=A0A0F9L6U9_9ZZZZ